jgi:hypothetical protein
MDELLTSSGEGPVPSPPSVYLSLPESSYGTKNNPILIKNQIFINCTLKILSKDVYIKFIKCTFISALLMGNNYTMEACKFDEYDEKTYNHQTAASFSISPRNPEKPVEIYGIIDEFTFIKKRYSLSSFKGIKQ